VPHGDLVAAADAVVATLVGAAESECRADLSSWGMPTIHDSYRRVFGDVVKGARRAG
jgi:hypothetical protein